MIEASDSCVLTFISHALLYPSLLVSPVSYSRLLACRSHLSVSVYVAQFRRGVIWSVGGILPTHVLPMEWRQGDLPALLTADQPDSQIPSGFVWTRQGERLNWPVGNIAGAGNDRRNGTNSATTQTFSLWVVDRHQPQQIILLVTDFSLLKI